MAIICTTASAATTPATPRSLISVHAARDRTWEWQRASGHCCTPYYWGADRASTTLAERWGYATRWWDRATAAHASFVAIARARAAATPWPSWFDAAIHCIAIHEEGGHNSTAGYLGLIYSPSAYGGVAAELAGTYGQSWLNWPWVAQERVAWMLYGEYGFRPWSTASACGLG